MEQFFCKVVSVKFSSIVFWECALNALPVYLQLSSNAKLVNHCNRLHHRAV